MVFKEIRNMMGVSNGDYLQSIGPQSIIKDILKAEINPLQELVSSGKSGSFFYYSSDGRYILKTVHHHEFLFLKKILKSYHDHLMKHPSTRIVKFYGMHKMRIKFKNTYQKLYFVIFNNLFQTYKEIHVRYDLKGSLYKRTTSPNADPSIARKDLDALQDGLCIDIDKEEAQHLYQSLVNDSEFFEGNDIIDYSLLLGVHTKEKRQSCVGVINLDNSQDMSKTDNNLNGLQAFEEKGINSKDGTKLYFIGVIDILTHFSTKKKLEYMAKSIAFGKTISAIPPKQYSKRYLDYIRQLLPL